MLGNSSCLFYDVNETELGACLQQQESPVECTQRSKTNLDPVSCSKYMFDDNLVDQYGMYSGRGENIHI